MSSKKIPVIIDCDPGTDDAIALLMAFAAANIDVLAVTTVCGNQTVDKTTLNALKILSFIHQEKTPVAKGAEKPLLRELHVASQVHGTSGLGGVILPDPTFDIQKENAVELSNKLLQHHKKVTLVCTGPLTNTALLLTAHPECKKNIEQIVLMGGGLDHGNCTPTAEFNILTDPEAAKIVFGAGIPIVMCGLDMTETALIKIEQIEEFAALKGKIAELATDIFRFYSEYYIKTGFSGIAMHDPTTIAYLMRPELFTTEDYSIQIETQGELTTGMTIADRRVSNDKEKPNTKVCTGIRCKEFVELVKECMVSYEEGTLI